ncbi:MAG: glycoside hydrolase family 127 protein, partial [Muribaculaceae bacterium]|nr:glycoside hydrolase family 127 protein [Muribaculaceae bacterium]
MKRLITAVAIAAAAMSAAAMATAKASYPISPVPFTSVKVANGFWSPRLQASRDVTIPLAFSKCEETGRYANFVNAVNPSDSITIGGFPFDDTDVYKTIEGASYLLQTYPDKKLKTYIDSVLCIV